MLLIKRQTLPSMTQTRTACSVQNTTSRADPFNKPSPWAEGDFEDKMANLLRMANALNRSVPAFREAQRLLENEESVLGQVVRRASQG